MEDPGGIVSLDKEDHKEKNDVQRNEDKENNEDDILQDERDQVRQDPPPPQLD